MLKNDKSRFTDVFRQVLDKLDELAEKPPQTPIELTNFIENFLGKNVPQNNQAEENPTSGHPVVHPWREEVSPESDEYEEDEEYPEEEIQNHNATWRGDYLFDPDEDLKEKEISKKEYFDEEGLWHSELTEKLVTQTPFGERITTHQCVITESRIGSSVPMYTKTCTRTSTRPDEAGKLKTTSKRQEEKWTESTESPPTPQAGQEHTPAPSTPVDLEKDL